MKEEDSAFGSSVRENVWMGSESAKLALSEAPGPVAHESATTFDSGLGDDLVYALGQIGQDFPTASRRTSFAQHIAEPSMLDDPLGILAHLDANPADASALQWTLDLDGVPIYVLQPSGPFAADVYVVLRQFLREQIEEGVERVSIPGVVSGAARHRSGLILPVVSPTLRGMFSWTTQALVSAVTDGAQASKKDSAKEVQNDLQSGISNFLDRVYYELRNAGRDPQERAINYAATNAFEVERVYERAINEQMELDTIGVNPSPMCIPGSNCWDVELLFFFPTRPNVRRLYRFTVDVADVVPATVGPMRTWAVR